MAIDKVAYWLDIATEDLGVAEDLYTRQSAGSMSRSCATRPSRKL